MSEIENTITLEELRRRQLARLKNGMTSNPATTVSSIPDESLDDAYYRACAEAEHGGWAVPDRSEWEREHREWLEKQRNRKQPENKVEPEPFQVGQPTGESYPRAAIPAPKWPAPGELMTREVVKAYDAEYELSQRANRALQDVIWWTRTRLREPDFWNATETNGRIQTKHAETLAWLQGIWQGRGIQAPTESQIEQWARDWPEKKSSAVTQKQNEPEPTEDS